MSAAGLLAALAALLVFAAVWEVAVGRRAAAEAAGRRAAGSAGAANQRLAPGGSWMRAALRLGLPERLRRSGLEPRLPLSAVLLGKVGGAVGGALFALVAAPAAPGRIGIAVAVGLPVAGFFGPDALLEREARRRRRRLVAALPDALDLLAVSVASGRGPGAGLEQLARAGEGPLAEEMRIAAAELSLGSPSAPPWRRCGRAFPAASWRRWSPRSSARAASGHRSPISSAARPVPCAATAAAPSRSAPPAPRRRSSSSSPSSSCPRSC